MMLYVCTIYTYTIVLVTYTLKPRFIGKFNKTIIILVFIFGRIQFKLNFPKQKKTRLIKFALSLKATWRVFVRLERRQV